jgi:hypothetical protein
MAGKTHVYDPASLVVVFFGIPMQGFAEDSVVEVAYNEDAFTLQMGVDGDGTRSKTNNRSAQITVSLMQSSLVNDLLNQVHQLDLNSPNGLGIGPLLIKDLNGRSLHAADKAWIMKSPDAAYAKEAGAREWVIETASLVSSYGGN